MSSCNLKLLRKIIANWSLAFTVTLLSLSIYSTEWVRMNFMEYYFKNEYYGMAIDKGMEIIRKEAILRKFGNESANKVSRKWDDRMAVIVERQATLSKNQWKESRTFFAFDKINIDEIDTLFDKIRFIIGNNLVDEFHSWENYNKYFNSKKNPAHNKINSNTTINSHNDRRQERIHN